MVLSARAVSIGISSALLLLATGCGVDKSSLVQATNGTSQAKISGRLRGGQQPVSGALIQLYAANSTTDQGASTPLLTSSSVFSDVNGNFNLTGDYTCPSSNPLIYIVATGGNPGLGGSANNSSIAMMSLLGTCTAVQANAASTFIFIDELTTVVSAYYLAPFMTDGAHVGASATNPIGLASAFESVAGYIDFTTGSFQGGNQNQQLPQVTFNSLADIIGACINSAGGTAGDKSPCGNLFSDTTNSNGTPADTIVAALHIAQTPGNNVTQLYALIPATAPFQPYFTSAPTDFTATTGYTLNTGQIKAGILDSNGHIWLYTAGYNYNTLTNISTDDPGVITVYDGNFNQLFTISPGTGGMYYPVSMGRDNKGDVYLVNSNNTISEFNSSGTALSPAAGWSTGFASSFSPSGSGNNFITPDNSPSPILTDHQGNVYGPSVSGSSCFYVMNSSGVITTPSGGNFCSSISSASIEAFSIDGSGGMWALSPTAIGKANTVNGNYIAAAPLSQGCFYPSSNALTSPNPVQAFESTTLELLYDHVNNQVWGYSLLGAGVITNPGVGVFCDTGSSTLPVNASYATTSTTPGSAYSAGSLLIQNAVLDGAGNLWFVSSGVNASGVVGSVSNTFSGTVTYGTYLGEISPTGTLLTPYNMTNQTYGLQPAGLGINNSATGSNVSISSESFGASLLGIDNSGNIWALDSTASKLLKISGLAVPNTANY